MKGIISLLIAASATLFGKGAKASGASAIAPSSFCGKSVEEIGIVYYAEGGWTDNAGWTAALELLPEHGDYKINMLNLDHLTGIEYGTTLYETTMRWFDQQDVLFVKSNWDWTVDYFVRNHLQDCPTPKVILISGCAAPPQNDVDIQFYDALAYETMWYANEHDLQKRHPNVHHAFGIDTRVMHSLPEVEKVWDLLFVGWIADYKRLDLFIARFKRMKHDARSKSLPMPRALVIGNNSMEESKALTARILRAGIHMLEEVPYADLVEIINASREMYIPARIDGGGERAVLEARSCGVEISVEQDNPKLLELATPTNPFFDEVYYARQLHQIVLSLNLPGRGKDYQDV